LTFDTGWKTTNNGSAEFVASLSGLEPGTTYYYRAYAYNGYKYGYGDKLSFSTPAVPPTVGEVTISDMQSTSVKATAELTHGGGSPVTARGFVWTSQAADPTIISNEGFTNDMTGVIGSFTATLTPLQEGKVYRVRAYATNGVDTGYGPVEVFTICPPTITRYHAAGHNGAAVSKEVTYGVVSSNISGDARCWITQNLGADSQAASAADNSDAAAGWYFQFNRPQGYTMNGSARTPNNTTWASVNETGEWDPANDPCTLLLGAGWRLPTSSEWTIADGASENWTNHTEAYSSVLKLHDAGFLSTSAVLTSRGALGLYWSSTNSDNLNGLHLRVGPNESSVTSAAKSHAFTVRCLQDTVVTTKPSVSRPTFSSITATSATSTSVVSLDGGLEISDRGFIWNTTGVKPDLENNLNADHVVSPTVTTGSGPFAQVFSGLDQTHVYYVWAYAKNDKGINYSERADLILCPDSFNIQHVAGHNGAPETIEITYHSVSSTVTGKQACWLTQDLGAAAKPTSGTDKSQQAMGWFWQYNNRQAYKYAIAASSTTPGAFLGPNAGSTWSEADDPCRLLIGGGWRMPTAAEWIAADAAPQNWSTVTNAFDSGLKLHSPGFLSTNRALTEAGTRTGYWTNTSGAWLQLGTAANSAGVFTGVSNAHGFLLRCIRDAFEITPPSLTDVTVSEMTSNAAKLSVTVVLDGGSQIMDRGFVWNETGAPPVIDSDHTVRPAQTTGTGQFSVTLGGLQEYGVYHVWAFAKSSVYGYVLTKVNNFKLCPPLTRQHMAGVNGAPATIKISYNVVSSLLSGEPACWIAQNLGAETQGGNPVDTSPAAAGWYWQFGTAQGYEYKASRVPATAWTGPTTQNSNWTQATDPCHLLLGSGWRLPTKSEYTNADAQWTKIDHGFESELKLHGAGYIDKSSGAIGYRGRAGAFWSSDTDIASAANGWHLGMNNLNGDVSIMASVSKSYGLSVRCILIDPIITAPIVSGVTVSDLTSSTLTASANIVFDGGEPLVERGIVWNISGAPTLDNNAGAVKENFNSAGTYSMPVTGLSEGLYYIRAYARNGSQTGYGPVENVVICAPVTRMHAAGINGAPMDKTIAYHTVSSTRAGTGAKCWITQNLGADTEATSASDASQAAAGWSWQFNRKQGFYLNTLDNSIMPATWDAPVEASAWSAVNDPCTLLIGAGWRIPTSSEWAAVKNGIANANAAFSSELKLHTAGAANVTDRKIIKRGTDGYYWSSTNLSNAFNNAAWYFTFNGTASSIGQYLKSDFYPVRCIQDQIIKSPPELGNTTILEMSATTALVKSAVLSLGDREIKERGFVWTSQSRNPSRSTDSYVPVAGSGVGYFSASATDLNEGLIYTVSSYAILQDNSVVYGTPLKFTICLPFTVTHVAGMNGAPVGKTITYNTVSSTLSGTRPQCWITRNLGADREALGDADKSDLSAGWYYKFNRAQGIEFNSASGVRNPTSWEIPREVTDWSLSNDPCRLLLGTGWRIPTKDEWTNVKWKFSSLQDGYRSELRLHGSGTLVDDVGAALIARGDTGIWWSSKSYSQYGAWWYKLSNRPESAILQYEKEDAIPVRCLKDIN
ncbi:MAG TPA: hypothetical protein VGE26_07420, partial [Sphingobacteriaceae bacterium]